MGKADKDGEARAEVSRRALLGGGAALAALGVAACGGPPAGAPGGEQAPSRAAGEGGVSPFELDEITFDGLQEGMASGRWTSESITELYLRRIGEVDAQGPTLRSVLETNPDALEIARGLDQERAAGQVRGPLHGIPILIKDNIATHDRTTTTAGSLALEGSIPAADSGVARKLREAGAVILGKANLSEWANFRSTRSSSGWSGRGGQCKNPYALDRNPCGSSSGSGAAAAANLAAATIGTETNGSVVCPSTANGIVGIKPTVGLISRSRIIPISHTQDTAGPMARTVRDAAILLGALAGPDPEDGATAAAAGKAHADYTQFLDPGGLEGARIGVARNVFGFHEKVDQLLEDAVQALKDGGAVVIDPTETPAYGDFEGSTFEVLLYEFKAGLDAYLEALGPEAPVKSLAEVIAFNEANAGRSMPYFGQEILLQAQEKGPLTEGAYLEALAKARRISREEGLDKLVDEHELDAIVAPTGGPAWKTDLVNGDNFGGSSSTPAAVSGYPNITVPAGFVHGLPVGMSIFGKAWTEPKLLRIAYAFEQATKHRKAPKFLPSLDFGTPL